MSEEVNICDTCLSDDKCELQVGFSKMYACVSFIENEDKKIEGGNE